MLLHNTFTYLLKYISISLLYTHFIQSIHVIFHRIMKSILWTVNYNVDRTKQALFANLELLKKIESLK